MTRSQLDLYGECVFLQFQRASELSLIVYAKKPLSPSEKTECQCQKREKINKRKGKRYGENQPRAWWKLARHMLRKIGSDESKAPNGSKSVFNLVHPWRHSIFLYSMAFSGGEIINKKYENQGRSKKKIPLQLSFLISELLKAPKRPLYFSEQQSSLQ